MGTIRFGVVGNGELYIEKNHMPMATVFPGESVPIPFQNGDNLLMGAIAYVGASFINLCDVPQTECITNAWSSYDITDANALPQKMVAHFTPASGGGGGGGTGFTIKADKVSSGQAFTAHISVDYPAKAGSTISLLRKGLVLTGDCVVNDIHLDSSGHAEFDYQVTESHTIQGLEGIGCCSVLGPQCNVSNTLSLSVGTNWGTIALWAAGLLAAAYIVGSVVSRRSA